MPVVIRLIDMGDGLPETANYNAVFNKMLHFVILLKRHITIF